MELSAEHQACASRWLLSAQLLVILPLYRVLPPWTMLVWLSSAVWYWKILNSGWRFPPTVVKLGLMVLTVAGIHAEYGRFFAVEPMVAVLVLAVVLKLLELKSQRDHWLILFLCYFILACGFLFEQGILALVLALLQLLVLLSAQQVLFRTRSAAGPMLRLSAIMLTQALPTMLFLFLVFPRIGPLWSMPLPSERGRTGMSDSLEFGDIAQLSQSGELAFRARFANGQMPAVANLYWRGLVLEDFEGRGWRRDSWASWRRSDDAPEIAAGSDQYTVTLESNLHEWVYTLAPARVDQAEIRYGGSYQWVTQKPLLGRLQYTARSTPSASRREADERLLKRNLLLPGTLNPQARALGARLHQQFGDPEQRLTAALQFFQGGNFEYTLQPPRLGANNVDQFLFGSRSGFCEHFAGSFVFVMRASGIPARVVVGYLGGEYNTEQGYLLVHQSDAHAWAEVWLENRGWQRVDPTAMVSPDRINRGADVALRRQQGFLGESPLSLRRFVWATRLRMFADNINYAWARWVVNYDVDSQVSVMVKILGRIDIQRILLAMVIGVVLPLLLVALWAIRPALGPHRDPLDRCYLACCRTLEKKTGLRRREGETPLQFLDRVGRDAPQWRGWFAEVTHLYMTCRYGPMAIVEGSGAKRELRRLRTLRRSPRPNLA